MEVYQLCQIYPWFVRCTPDGGKGKLEVEFRNKKTTYEIPFGISLLTQDFNVALATVKPVQPESGKTNVKLATFNDHERELLSIMIQGEPAIYVDRKTFADEARKALSLGEIVLNPLGKFTD